MKYYRYPVDIPPAYITWGFGAWDNSVLTSQRYQHRGIDIGCPVGTPMYSPGAGTVYEHNGDGSFGLNVAISHDEGYFSIMAHMSNPIVKPGDIVKPGQLIGYSGNTGLSTGPHVHWQVCLDSWFPRDISRSRDPESFLVNEPIPEEDDMDEAATRKMVAEMVFGLQARYDELVALGVVPLESRVAQFESGGDTVARAAIATHEDGHGVAAPPRVITISGPGLTATQED